VQGFSQLVRDRRKVAIFDCKYSQVASVAAINAVRTEMSCTGSNGVLRRFVFIL
jgi:hypothetical protein